MKENHGKGGIDMKGTLARVRAFLLSPVFLFIPAAVSMAGTMLGDEARMPCMIVNAMLVAVALVLSDNFLAAFMPFMGVMVNGTQYFDAWTDILDYILWAIPVALAFLFHFIVYRKPARCGMSGRGNFAVALAIILGGLGVMSWEDMTSAEGLYHYVMLSAGLFLLYVVFYSNLAGHSFAACEWFLWCMFYVGLAVSVLVLSVFFTHLGSEDPSDFGAYQTALYFRNSVAPLLVMAMPAPFYFAKKKGPWYTRLLFFFMGVGFYGAALLTCARTALLFGTVLFGCCILYFLIGRGDIFIKCLCMGLLLLGAVAAWQMFRDKILWLVTGRLLDGKLISGEEARAKYFVRSLWDLLRYPMTGIGMVSFDNHDLAASSEGSLVWYHLYFPQIWGSMGIFGMAAYTYRAIIRFRLVSYRPTVASLAVALSALGMLLYSQTDPGEFVPIPYGIMVVLAYAVLDRRYDETTLSTLEDRKKILYFPKE